ncbi:hypothetical protein [Paraferrimonas sp. SM1919]|uniref:hypothetical protein n=1 Tax=Paraferrimonas sp. SM1919 TaxID=2662263 RepID=UPI0013D8BE78|nr:hypothetical protein [Paraferrimonas sp. SM1919]
MKKLSMASATTIVSLTMFNCAWAAQQQTIDPSDPTTIATWMDVGAESQTVHDGAGNTGSVNAVRGEMNFALGAEHLILTEFGYAKSEGVDSKKSGMLDTRLRYFNLPYQNDNNDDFIQAAGWSLDVTLPTGDYKSQLGTGMYTVAIGGMTKHVINDSLMILPNISYVYSKAGSALEKDLIASGQGAGLTHHGLRADLFVSYKFTDAMWGMAVPSYTKGLQGAADAANIKLYLGYMFSGSDGIKLEYQKNFTKEQSIWKRVTQGMEDYVRFTYTHYF